MKSIPETWQRTTVGDLCSFESGTGFGPVDWTDSGLPIIRIQNLNGSQDFNYFSGTPDPSWIVEPGELLFAWAGVKGVSFGPTIWCGARGVLNQHIYRVRPTRDVVLEWLYLQLMHVTAVIEAHAHGFKSNLVHVRKSDITGQVCFKPPLREQREIASVMAAWDRAIRRLNDLIAAKLCFKQGLMQQLLAGKRRFPGFCDDWRTVHLKDVAEECEERNRGRLGTDSVMAVTKAEGIVPMRERTIAADIDRYSVVKKDYFAYNPMRLNIGSIARWSGEQDVLVSPDYVVFRCKQPVKDAPAIDSDFLDQYRRSRLWERYVTSAGNGSVRVRIYFSDLGRMRLKLPSLPEQRKIVAVLNAADREIDLLRTELDALKKQKKGLMQKLLTGQVRVKLSKGDA